MGDTFMSRQTFKADFIRNDEEKRRRIQEAGSEKDHKGADAVVVYDHTWGTVEACGLGSIFQNRLVKILTKKGIAQWSVLRFDYDPNSYINDVRRLRIHRSDGKIEEVPVKEFADIYQPERLLYWRVRMKLCTIPHLEIGDAIEYEIFRKGFQIAYLAKGGDEIAPEYRRDYVDPETGLEPPMYGAFYEIFYFDEKIPIKEKRYTLVAPVDMPLYSEVYHGEVRSSLVREKDHFVYSWEKTEVPGYKPEPRMWGPQSALTKLLVSSIPDWRAKSRWFWDRNKEQFHSSDDIEAMTKKVVRGCKTDEEKAAALCHWVAQEIRYIGFSIGKGEGFTLHPGTMTFPERGGVCKDIAGMLVTMMRCIGLEAYPAQTEALEPVDRITADQFGHCVVGWKKKDGSWQMLDPTWAVFGMDTWDAAETSQNYLTGTPEGEDLGCTPARKPEDSLLRIDATTTLAKTGDLRGEVRWWGRGRGDSTQRMLRVRRPAWRMPATAYEVLSTIDPEIEVGKIDRSEVTDLYKNYRQKADFKVPAYGLADDQGLFFQLPMARLLTCPVLNRYLDADELDTRKFDMRVVFLYQIEVDETIKLPAGYRLASRPFSLDIDTAPASFKAKLSVKGDTLRFTADFAVKVRSVTTKQYKDFKKVVKAAKELSKRMIRVKKAPSRAKGGRK